jgi:hypothetical protein
MLPLLQATAATAAAIRMKILFILSIFIVSFLQTTNIHHISDKTNEKGQTFAVCPHFLLLDATRLIA